jgi:hypothetical protein
LGCQFGQCPTGGFCPGWLFLGLLFALSMLCSRSAFTKLGRTFSQLGSQCQGIPPNLVAISRSCEMPRSALLKLFGTFGKDLKGKLDENANMTRQELTIIKAVQGEFVRDKMANFSRRCRRRGGIG